MTKHSTMHIFFVKRPGDKEYEETEFVFERTITRKEAKRIVKHVEGWQVQHLIKGEARGKSQPQEGS